MANEDQIIVSADVTDQASTFTQLQFKLPDRLLGNAGKPADAKAGLVCYARTCYGCEHSGYVPAMGES